MKRREEQKWRKENSRSKMSSWLLKRKSAVWIRTKELSLLAPHLAVSFWAASPTIKKPEGKWTLISSNDNVPNINSESPRQFHFQSMFTCITGNFFFMNTIFNIGFYLQKLFLWPKEKMAHWNRTLLIWFQRILRDETFHGTQHRTGISGNENVLLVQHYVLCLKVLVCKEQEVGK